VSDRLWPVHAATGPAAGTTSATLAALAAHVPHTLVAAANATFAPERSALASFAAYVARAAITAAM